jgi:hypothetical protein
MRNRLKYGVPALVGLGAAGAAAAQDGNPLEVLGAGGAAALGGAAGLLGARALAGKYSPELMARIQQAMDAPRGDSGQSIRQRTETAIRQSPEYRERGPSRTLYDPQSIGNRARTALLEAPASINAAAPSALGAVMVPAAGVAAGLGGMAAGQLVGGVGQLMGIDPEAPGSSNTMGSRMSMQSPMLPMY